MELFFQSETTVVILFRSTHKNLTNDKQRCLLPSLEVVTHYGIYGCEETKQGHFCSDNFPFVTFPFAETIFLLITGAIFFRCLLC